MYSRKEIALFSIVTFAASFGVFYAWLNIIAWYVLIA
jgi:hypothetical protein